jgi:hypothetical protein
MRLLAISKANQDVTQGIAVLGDARELVKQVVEVWMEGGRAGRGGGAANLEAAH